MTAISEGISLGKWGTFSYQFSWHETWLVWAGLYFAACVFASIASEKNKAVPKTEKDFETLDRFLKPEQNANEETNALAPLEAKYQEAVNAQAVAQRSGDINGLLRTAELFEALGNYKDSESLAETSREQINIEHERGKQIRNSVIIFIVLTVIILMLLKNL